MKFNDILNEINMAPASLARRAAAIKPLVGLEYELILKNPKSDDPFSDNADFSDDPYVGDISDIEEFFDSSYMPRANLRRECQRIQRDYEEYVINEQVYEWRNVGDDYFKKYVQDNALSDEEAEEQIELGELSYLYDDAHHDWESKHSKPTENEWLRDQRIYRMSEVLHHYNLVWPHYYGNASEAKQKEMADDLARYFPGFRVSYMGNRLNPNANTYELKDDSSVMPSDKTPGFQGKEVTTPPLPLDQLYRHYQQFLKWAEYYHSYTNNTCGLHINVSIPGANMANMDYVKLVLLLGDQHVLDQFGRLTNSYCTSSYRALSMKVISSSAAAREALEKAKHHLNLEASRAFYHSNPNKHVSVNVRLDRVEFRAAGGDWMNKPIDQIFNTIHRCVVAMASALDPNQDREEYAKKFYKLLAPSRATTSPNHIKFFVDYVSGTLSKAQIKTILQHERTHATLAKAQTSKEAEAKKSADDYLHRFASELHPDPQGPELDEVRITDNPTAGYQYGEEDPDAWIGRDYGAGLTGINRNIDYEGYRVSMKPSKFLALSAPLPDDYSSDVERHLAKGGSIGAPFLYVKIPEDWTEQGKFTQPATVTGHEGRHRMRWILRNEGDDPVEVHMVFRGGLRRRHVTDQMMAAIKKELLSQKNNSASQRIVTNTFEDYKK